jgi:KDO2-lipid IV(A) lauroyltransferase
MDAGWTALTQQLPRRFTTIYTDQANKTWMPGFLLGRQRFGKVQLFGRADGVKAIVSALRVGAIRCTCCQT